MNAGFDCGTSAKSPSPPPADLVSAFGTPEGVLEREDARRLEGRVRGASCFRSPWERASLVAAFPNATCYLFPLCSNGLDFLLLGASPERGSRLDVRPTALVVRRAQEMVQGLHCSFGPEENLALTLSGHAERIRPQPRCVSISQAPLSIPPTTAAPGALPSLRSWPRSDTPSTIPPSTPRRI